MHNLGEYLWVTDKTTILQQWGIANMNGMRQQFKAEYNLKDNFLFNHPDFILGYLLSKWMMHHFVFTHIKSSQYDTMHL